VCSFGLFALTHLYGSIILTLDIIMHNNNNITIAAATVECPELIRTIIAMITVVQKIQPKHKASPYKAMNIIIDVYHNRTNLFIINVEIAFTCAVILIITSTYLVILAFECANMQIAFIVEINNCIGC